MPFCGARTTKGRSCRNPVSSSGERCWRHGGGRSIRYSHRSAGRPSIRHRYRSTEAFGGGYSEDTWDSGRDEHPTPAPRQHERASTWVGFRRWKLPDSFLDTAVEVTTEGWQEAVSRHFAEVLGDELWSELKLHGNCDFLAFLARCILRYERWPIEILSRFMEWLLLWMRFGRVESRVARVLVKHIPLPWDKQMAALAQSLRIIGIYLCAVAGDLSTCQCLVDLSRAIAVNRITDTLKEFLVRASHDDWLPIGNRARSAGHLRVVWTKKGTRVGRPEDGDRREPPAGDARRPEAGA